MAEYIQLNKYGTKSGELAISHRVFEQIATDAANRVIDQNPANKNKLKIYSPIKVVFNKENQVSIKVSISVKSGVKPADVSLEIQKEIARDLIAYVESVPFDIEVSVDEIKK